MYILLFIAIVVILYFASPWIQKIAEWLISKFTDIPKGFRGKILPAFIRGVILNWYTYLVLTLIWALLFFTEIGKDVIDAYLSNLKTYEFLLTFRSSISLFFSLLLMSLSIWTVPFFMYSAERRKQALLNYKQFYLGVKMLSFVAMLPFLIVTNGFLSFSQNTDTFLAIILVNSVSFILFIVLVYLFTLKIPFLSTIQFKKFFPNTYLFILIRIIISILILTLFFALIKTELFRNAGLSTLSYLTFIYFFTSSAIVFRLLFYTNEPKSEDIVKLVAQMLNQENKKHSKQLYVLLFASLTLIVFYYYLVPSLEPTNALYILVIVFSFYIIYLDYWRHIFNNRKGFWKISAFFASIFFVAAPFLSPEGQFTIKFINKPNDITGTITLDSALKQRYNYITQNGLDTGNIFIVCGMGGGSRAGYITASTLKAIDKMNAGLWEHTICYSTVSGSSVGLYNYIKGRTSGLLYSDSNYLKNLYQRNYNSSGVYGLLIGDAIETLFGPLVTKPKGWVCRDSSATGFYDRNFRIRREYDYVLDNAFSEKPSHKYFSSAFYPWTKQNLIDRDTFQTYFIRQQGKTPIHLINTFEVNSGRRTVISPFPSKSTDFFSNSILPLQDTTFADTISRKDITYREAINLSELFPLISAASFIGDKKAQFVDGGYYENYGLATGLDVFYYLTDSMHIPTKRIKFLLIKNSNQVPPDSGQQIQLLAPLVGVTEAPFTGHANNLLAEAKRVLVDSNHFKTLTFNAGLKKVPLTRSLTKRHIDSMAAFTQFILKDSTKNALIKFIQH